MSPDEKDALGKLAQVTAKLSARVDNTVFRLSRLRDLTDAAMRESLVSAIVSDPQRENVESVIADLSDLTAELREMCILSSRTLAEHLDTLADFLAQIANGDLR